MALYDLGCNTWDLTGGGTNLSVFLTWGMLWEHHGPHYALITPTHAPRDIPEFTVVMDPENH